MPLVYITGISGAGKSAVLDELRARGYTAFGVDEDGFAGWITNTAMSSESSATTGVEPNLAEHAWAFDVSKVRRLAHEAAKATGPVFLCGIAANEDEVRAYFSETFALVAEDEIIKHRIQARTSNDFGKSPDQLAQILSWNSSYASEITERGAILVDASVPVSDVVDRILSSLDRGGLGR